VFKRHWQRIAGKSLPLGTPHLRASFPGPSSQVPIIKKGRWAGCTRLGYGEAKQKLHKGTSLFLYSTMPAWLRIRKHEISRDDAMETASEFVEFVSILRNLSPASPCNLAGSADRGVDVRTLLGKFGYLQVFDAMADPWYLVASGRRVL
jgi:hypothetical protein